MPGFAAQLVGEQHRGVAHLLTLLCRRRTQLPNGAGDLGGDVGQFLGGLLRQQFPCLLAEL